jgi:signal transduction histidine kinase
MALSEERKTMSKTKRFWRNNRFRMLLTLELAVMLPAAALIYFNYRHLHSIEHDKVLEATIHRDFQEMLAISEKKINEKAYTVIEAVAKGFPCPDSDTDMDKVKKLDMILAENPWLARVFLYEPKKGLILRSQPEQMHDKYFREEHERTTAMFGGWLGMENKMMAEGMRKKKRHVTWYGGLQKRGYHQVYMNTAFFLLPDVDKERNIIGGATFDPDYLKEAFFPKIMHELITYKLTEERGNPLAMTIFPSEYDGYEGEKLLAASSGWREGKPEVTRKMDDVFQGLTLGIQFQGTSADALGQRWMRQSFIVLGVLSLMLVGGLVLTYRSVSKEMEVAKLKSDFVSNVSHELRTPLSLIRLYAETLELGRIQTQDKVEEYYRIIRKESERLTALINNILDFSRIEAGRKEYEFRETDIGELVRNTLDSYRDQIEQQGFDFEQHIDPSLPAVQVDREAIARSLVNLVNNALKYSAKEKFLRVRLYRSNGSVKLEVADRGIGIARNEHAKIFEKFYRVGDPLVHNTKGSGLGLSLVRHIAQAHGGEVEVESTPGKGSKFTLSLPVAAIPQETAQSAASGAKAS